MLVFSKQKLVFLSVPKTGTTAYQAALAPHASIIVTDPPELKHAPVFRYNRYFRPMFEKFMGEDLKVMAVMREPISWLGSWYRYRQRPAMSGHENSTAGISFDDFVLAYIKGRQPSFANVGSQAKFLEQTRNGTAITHLFKYEDQAELQKFLQGQLNCKIDTDRLNVSPPSDLVLQPETERRLRRKRSIEFELYDSIGPCGHHVSFPADST